MDTKDFFAQLKDIEPRKEFTAHSRRLIVSSPYNSGSVFIRVKRTAIDMFRMGTAIALASALLAVIVNATFLWKVLPTPQVAVLDPVGLRAEAQAIDIQIKLAQLNFGDLAVAESSTPRSVTLPPPAPGSAAAILPATGSATATVSSSAPGDTGTAASATAAPVDIDGALQTLGN